MIKTLKNTSHSTRLHIVDILAVSISTALILFYAGNNLSYARVQCSTVHQTIENSLYPSEVNLTKSAYKDLKKLPKYIQESYFSWQKNIHTIGVKEVRKIPSYHDEPLHIGGRSVRLNQAYRIFYHEVKYGDKTILEVTKINNHKY